MVGRARVIERSAGPAPRVDGRAVAAGVIATFALTVMVSAALAVAIYLTDITETHVSGILYYVGLLSVAVGGGVAARRASSRGWLHGGLAGLAYVVLSLVIGSLLFPGSAVLVDAGRKLVTAFVAGAVGGVVGVNI